MDQEAYGKHTKAEILSQPEIWEQVVNSWPPSMLKAFPRTEDYDQVLFIGCGSTFFLSRWAARMHEAHSGSISRAVPSSDLLLQSKHWIQERQKTLLIASSRSASTTETIKAIDSFKANHTGDVIVITCNQKEPMGSQSEFVISAEQAQEESIAQTRSFSSMLLAHAFYTSGGLPANIGKDLREAGDRLINETLPLAERIAQDTTLQRFFFLGSGPLYGLANECMLKMKEISQSYAESFHNMEFRHGPMSMVDQHTLVIGFIGDQGAEQDLAVLADMKVKGARTLAIANRMPEKPAGLDHVIQLDSPLPMVWRSALYLPPMQWLAFNRGLVNGLNPDRPHNLDAVVVLDE